VIAGISVADLPKKYEDTPYIFDPYSFRNSALSTGKVSKILLIDPMN